MDEEFFLTKKVKNLKPKIMKQGLAHSMWHTPFSDWRFIKEFDSDVLSGKEAHVKDYNYCVLTH